MPPSRRAPGVSSGLPAEQIDCLDDKYARERRGHWEATHARSSMASLWHSNLVLGEGQRRSRA
jgi:hypothetical protein